MALKEYEKCSNVLLTKNSFFDNIRAIFMGHSYPYSVVYTDGFISQNRKDGVNRTPFGIIVKGIILRIDAPDEPLSLEEASLLIKNQVFAGYKAYLPPIDVLKYIKKNIKDINRLILQLGGDEFVGDWYASCNEYNDYSRTTGHLVNKRDLTNLRVWAVHMNSPCFLNSSYTLVGDKIRIRLVYLF